MGEDGIALFLDFDGTLVDIAPTPDAISVPHDLAERLAALSARLDGRLALVSGRSIEDLESHLGSLAVARAGSHGSDCRNATGDPVGEPPAGLAQSTRDPIAAFAEKEGFALEEKAHGMALHYRSDPSLEGVAQEFSEQLAREHQVQVKRGKCVIELVAPGTDKARAVDTFMQTAPFAGAKPVFVGDDVTDEDGMRAAIASGGFGIAVGKRPSDNARYKLASVAAVREWLQL